MNQDKKGRKRIAHWLGLAAFSAFFALFAIQFASGFLRIHLWELIPDFSLWFMVALCACAGITSICWVVEGAESNGGSFRNGRLGGAILFGTFALLLTWGIAHAIFR
jgi:hypothetical protein